jgi:hypothetical protein
MRVRALLTPALLLLAAACAEHPTTATPPPGEPGPPALTAVGLYEIGVSGLGTADLTATVRPQSWYEETIARADSSREVSMARPVVLRVRA